MKLEYRVKEIKIPKQPCYLRKVIFCHQNYDKNIHISFNENDNRDIL